MSNAGYQSHEQLNPSFRQEDQEMAQESLDNPVPQVVGPGAYASPDPATNTARLVPIEEHPLDLSSDYGSAFTKTDAPATPMTDLDAAKGVSGAGTAADDEKKKAADWKAEVDAVTTKDEYNALADRYEASGAAYTTVDKAFEKKAEELDAAEQ